MLDYYLLGRSTFMQKKAKMKQTFVKMVKDSSNKSNKLVTEKKDIILMFIFFLDKSR